jgi:hypothetical protein
VNHGIFADLGIGNVGEARFAYNAAKIDLAHLQSGYVVGFDYFARYRKTHLNLPIISGVIARRCLPKQSPTSELGIASPLRGSQ